MSRRCRSGRDARRYRGPVVERRADQPLNPVDLVIDHSVMIDEFGNPRAFQMNVDREYERNMERYTFLNGAKTRSTISASSHPAQVSATRSTLNILPDCLDRCRPDGNRWPTRTRSSAPTATPPWSTGSRLGLGCWRDRSRSRDAGPTDFHADPRGRSV